MLKRCSIDHRQTQSKSMVICSSPRQPETSLLEQGDYVRYIGANPKIKQDYSDQDLCIIAIDLISGLAVCDNKTGQRLVGVTLRELQKVFKVFG